MRLTLFRLCLTLAALLIGGGVANAGCTTSSASLTFAQSSSYAVQGGAAPQVSGAAGINCTGALISVLGGSYARATTTSANGFALKTAGGDSIPYQLSADSGGTVVFTQGGTVDYLNASLLTLLGIGSLNGFNPPIYARLTGTPNIPAGVYTDTVTVYWDYKVCNGIQIGPVCVLYETGQVSRTLTITLVVEKDCRISAPDIAFGSAAMVSQFASVSQAVLVDCTKNAAYNVAFSTGLSGAARPWRAMSNGSGDLLQYNIYRTDGITIWDETNPLASVLAGTGSTTPSQLQSYVAKINPAQTTPPPGAYTDTVSVVISF